MWSPTVWGMIALGMEALTGIAYQGCTIPTNAALLVMVAPDWHIDVYRPLEAEDAQGVKFEMPGKVLSGRASFPQ